MGWRGYVLPRLQASRSALVASLILGVVWGFWHLPRYLAPGNSGSFALMLVKVLADAVIYTWLYNNTRGSLLLTTLLHAAGNTASDQYLRYLRERFIPAYPTADGNQDVFILYDRQGENDKRHNSRFCSARSGDSKPRCS